MQLNTSNRLQRKCTSVIIYVTDLKKILWYRPQDYSKMQVITSNQVLLARYVQVFIVRIEVSTYTTKGVHSFSLLPF